MSQQRRMYLGTNDGVLVLGEDGSGWREERTSLRGKSVDTLVASNEAGTIFAGVAGDGVYVSSDAGASWDRALAGDVRSLAVDPTAPGTVYAGTEPVHLFRSVDAGDSWEEIESLQRMPRSVREKWWFPNYPHEGHVLSIAIDARDSRLMYLGLEHGGVVRTDDGGTSWEDVTDGIEYIDVHAVAVDPERRNVVYATTARGFYYSDNYGRDWALSIEGLTRDYMHACLVRPGPQPTLLMTTANGSPPSWMRSTGAESAVFRSTDRGLSWLQLRGGLPESFPRMVWGLAPDPTDETRLYIGASDHPDGYGPQKESLGGEVWMSTDRGETWAHVYTSPAPFHRLCVATV